MTSADRSDVRSKIKSVLLERVPEVAELPADALERLVAMIDDLSLLSDSEGESIGLSSQPFKAGKN